jgi:hypothetical protein
VGGPRATAVSGGFSVTLVTGDTATVTGCADRQTPAMPEAVVG